jgi:hypothetical protein
MKQVALALSLGAGAVGSLTTLAPQSPQPAPPCPPALAAPELRDLPVPTSPDPAAIDNGVPRAELTSYLFLRPTGHPDWQHVICVVRNSGPKETTRFLTLVTAQRADGQSVSKVFPLSLAPGEQQVITFPVWRPARVKATADFTHGVPEYDEELNNVSRVTAAAQGR